MDNTILLHSANTLSNKGLSYLLVLIELLWMGQSDIHLPQFLCIVYSNLNCQSNGTMNIEDWASSKKRVSQEPMETKMNGTAPQLF